jgi:hypothetical protein
MISFVEMKAEFKHYTLTPEQIQFIEKLEGENWEFKEKEIPTSIETIYLFLFKSPRCIEYIEYDDIKDMTETLLLKYEAWSLACQIIRNYETFIIGKYINSIEKALLSNKNLNAQNFKFGPNL